MGRASARSSTTTSAFSRARILAIEWPVASLALASAATLAFDDGGYFPPAPRGSPNGRGLVAAIGVLLATAFAAHARSQLWRALSAACLVVFVLTIFFTYSRGTWISLAVGLAAMAVVDPRRVALLRTAA